MDMVQRSMGVSRERDSLRMQLESRDKEVEQLRASNNELAKRPTKDEFWTAYDQFHKMFDDVVDIMGLPIVAAQPMLDGKPLYYAESAKLCDKLRYVMSSGKSAGYLRKRIEEALRWTKPTFTFISDEDTCDTLSKEMHKLADIRKVVL